MNDTDDWETQLDRVTLMTLHASKGLEFPCVYIVAVEEGLLPHERSRGVAEQLEEERRLMFVGITRAQQCLQISCAQYRDFRGERKLAVPSSFLMELPRGEMEAHQPDAARVVEIDDMPVDHEPVFRHDEPSGAGVSPALASICAGVSSESASENAAPRMPASVLFSARLQTAAEMLPQSGERPAVDPDAFRQGMVVLHTEFGLGKVVALGGSGSERTATVDFATGPGRKKVLLAAGALKPVK